MASPAPPSAVVPSEVGWQFVPQYYTFVNKEPHRLHCFYSKSSTFIHGTEGGEEKPVYGQKDIHEKILSIGFQDCKVFIHSVDAQSSANGGIILQVIGEMSNNNDAWRKFVQTFFLAEQPNGYYVLNDIFRFLKEESVDTDDISSEPTEQDHVQKPATPAYETIVTPTPEFEVPAREQTPPPVIPKVPTPIVATTPLPTVTQEEAPTTDIPEPPHVAQVLTPAAESRPATPASQNVQTNGIHTPEPIEKSVTPSQQTSSAASPVPPTVAAAATASSTTPTTSTSSAVPSINATSQQTPHTGVTPPVQPIPQHPPQPRSWASLAATNSRKWGAAVAQESRGTTEKPASPGPQAFGAGGAGAGQGRPQQHQGAPHHQQQHQQQHHGGQPAAPNVQSITTPQCFIKGVTEPVSQTTLANLLTGRFGAIKDLDIVRSKACAFLEFVNVDSARRAITASLPQAQGGEGGIWIDVPEAGQVRIIVETKKERGDRPVSRPRGGGPVGGSGEGRGGQQGGAGAGGQQGGQGGQQGGYRGRGGGGGGGRGRYAAVPAGGKQG